jgi:hypothetical protein
MAYDLELADRIRAIVEAEPGLTEKRMFGGLAFLIQGNMAVSASSQGGLLLRIDPAKSLLVNPSPARGAPHPRWRRCRRSTHKNQCASLLRLAIGARMRRSLIDDGFTNRL